MTSHRSLAVRLVLTAALALLGLGVAQAPAATAATDPDLGPNVMVSDPSMPTSQIQATVDAIYAQQVNNEMGSERYWSNREHVTRVAAVRAGRSAAGRR